MKKRFALVLAFTLVFALAACGRGGAAKNDSDKLVTAERPVTENSHAWNTYQCSSVHEEYIFEKDGTLVEYLQIWRFREDADRESALGLIQVMGWTEAEIAGDTLVVPQMNFCGFPLSEYKIDDVRTWLEDNGYEFQ